jgi:cyclopropane-fatty-acyl-phospholipid synthase
LRIASARFSICKVKNAHGLSVKSITIGNDLFSRMLDPYMQYSCAYWKDAQTLEDAQQAKLI